MNTDQCSQLLGNLSVYLDGETSEALCVEIEHHLEACEDCRVVVDTLRKTIELVRDLPQPDLPEDARERLYKSLDLVEQLRSRDK
jgi:predicted anti-sigma-YlaC factor YlaD